jgi:sugar phosphate isomerase/epimerase
MMKKAFTTLGNPEWSFDKTLAEAKRLGFDAIDIRGIDGKMRAEEIEIFGYGKMQDTRRKVEEAGLKICCFGTSASFHDESKLESALEETKAAIDLCAAMGIPYVRVFGNDVPDGCTPEEEAKVLATIARGIQLACDYAKGTSVKVLLEIHGTINTIERAQGIALQVRGENFGILWDVAHSDKIYKDEFEKFYRAIRPWVCHIHLKDHIRIDTKATKLVSTGEGEIPLAAIIKMLLADGYDGYFALEWEKKWHPDLQEPELEYPHFIEWTKKNIG